LLAQRAEHAPEREPAQALHGEIGGPVLVDAEIVDGDNRRVLELALHPDLAEEAGAELGVAAVVGQDHLERDVAADAPIAAEAHLAHRALAEGFVPGVAPAPRLFEHPLTGVHGHRGAARAQLPAVAW